MHILKSPKFFIWQMALQFSGAGILVPINHTDGITQPNGPWLYSDANLSVLPHEGIGAGGVAGVAYSVMTGVFGMCPFAVKDKVQMIRDYMAEIIRSLLNEKLFRGRTRPVIS